MTNKKAQKLVVLWLLFFGSISVANAVELAREIIQPGNVEFRGQWFNSTHHAWFEFPSRDISKLEVWGHTDRISYAPGETVKLHVNTTADNYDILITRDGGEQEVVLEKKGVPGKHYPTPNDVYKDGTGWPVSRQIRIPDDWKSGGYVITLRVDDGKGREIKQHAFFVVRPARPGNSRIAFVLATNTWEAYNDWGGSNFYQGVDGPDQTGFSPILSTQRPWARGLIWAQKGAPRIVADDRIEIGETPRYPVLEFAYARGYSKFFRAAGWATYDRLFARWAEQEGYTLDYYAQSDLHYHPEWFRDYKAIVIVGHDEYQTWEERKALDDYIEKGGKFVRLAGNVLWQVRRGNNTMICYKDQAEEMDPVRNDPKQKHLLTSAWESLAVNWPSVQTYGVNSLRGIYLKFGGWNPRATGGFTVYRPDHWALAGTDLYYGDVFGQESNIAGYEGDGLDYTFRYGLPYPTGEDGAPKDDIEIIAMALASQEEADHGNPATLLYGGDADMAMAARLLFGEDTPENRDKVRNGSSMIVNMKKGRGEVFTAANTEWVNGLKDRNPFVEIITRNVLNRYTTD